MEPPTAGARFHSTGSRQWPAGDGADRSAVPVYEHRALHGRDRLRLGAGPMAWLPPAARRFAPVRRPLHVEHRHVQQPAERLFLRDEPVGSDGRRAARRDLQQPAVGRDLDRQGAAQRHRLDARDRNPLQHAQLRSECRRVGHQLPAHGAAQERGERVERLAPQPGAEPAVERRPARRPRRHRRGARCRREAVRARQLGRRAGPRQRARDQRRRRRR